MLILICFIIGFCLGYYIRGQKQPAPQRPAIQNQAPQRSHVQRLYSKSQHYSDSDRIRDLNQLSTHQAAFLRLLKQTFFNYEVSIMKFQLNSSAFLFWIRTKCHLPFLNIGMAHKALKPWIMKMVFPSISIKP